MFYNQPLRLLPAGTRFVAGGGDLLAQIEDPDPYEDGHFDFYREFDFMKPNLKVLGIINPAEQKERMPFFQGYHPGHQVENYQLLRTSRYQLMEALENTFDTLCVEEKLGDGIYETYYNTLQEENIVAESSTKCRQLWTILRNPYSYRDDVRSLLSYSKRLQVFHNTGKLLHSLQGENWVRAADGDFPDFPRHSCIKVFEQQNLVNKIMGYSVPDMSFPSLPNEGLELSYQILSGIGPELNTFVATLSLFT